MRSKFCRFLSVALSVVLLVGMIGILPAIAQTSVSVALSVDQTEYKAEASGMLTVALSGISSSNAIAAMDFYIEYDESIVAFDKSASNIVSSAAGPIVASSDDITIASPDDGMLKVLFFGSNSTTIDSISQNGVLVTVPFTVLSTAKNGSSSISASFTCTSTAFSEGQACTAEGVSVDVIFGNSAPVNVYTPSFTNPYDFAQTDTESYESKGYISGFMVGDSITNVKADFAVKSGASITVKDAQGNTVAENSPIGTGMVITITDDTKSVSFTAVVFGDVNGDGIINTMDAASSNAYLASLTTPQGPFALAYDINKSGTIDTMDVAQINAYLASLLEIEQ